MLYGLGGGDEGGIKNRAVNLRNHLVGFFDNPVNRRTVEAFGRRVDQLKDLLQPAYVAFSFAQVGLEALFELGIASLADHFRQRFYDLLFGIVNVAQARIV
jgi:hypothetical protein